MITKTMLIKKDIWDLVKTGLRLLRENPTLFEKEIKGDQMVISITRYIIVKGVNSQIILNIIDLENPRDI